ncbi:MAG: hypothetical protein Q8S44_04150 [Flavobacteriaceae bacterium]|nr:hypothetical protein [Flavobacteriaceae bacterium]
MKKIATLLVFFLAMNLSAQENDYNAKTLSLFNEGNWKDLIELAKEAQEKNQSTYEIDYRLAVAYYNAANYFDSTTQFKKLIATYDVSYDYIKEYLYFSYLFSGREADALLLAKDFPFHLKLKIDAKEPQFIDYVYTEGGAKVSSRRDIDIDNLSYFNLGLGHNLGSTFNIYHSFSTLKQKYIDFDYKQSEYYLSANVQLSEGLTLIPAYHYLKITDQDPQYETVSVPGGGNRLIRIYVGVEDQKIHVFHLGLKKQWGRLTLTPNVTSSSSDGFTDTGAADKINQLQYGFDLGYSLKSFNDRVWIGFGGYMHNDEVENNFIWNVKTYFQLTPKTYLFAKYNQSEVSNFSEDNASVFVNALSKSKDKISGTLGTKLSNTFHLYLNYQFENVENTDNTTIVNNFNFTYSTFIVGLKIDL